MENKEAIEKKWVKRSNLIIILVIFIGVTLASILNPTHMVVARVENDVLILEGYEDTAFSISLDAIEDISYAESVNYGETTQDILCETGTNEQWGEYVLYVNTETAACVVIESKGITYLFNCVGEDITKDFYEALLERV